VPSGITRAISEQGSVLGIVPVHHCLFLLRALKNSLLTIPRTDPFTITSDACASHAGEEIHNAGLLLISRFIGKRQVLPLQEVIRQKFDAEVFTTPKAHP
jgi:hypothetical protein